MFCRFGGLPQGVASDPRSSLLALIMHSFVTCKRIKTDNGIYRAITLLLATTKSPHFKLFGLFRIRFSRFVSQLRVQELLRRRGEDSRGCAPVDGLLCSATQRLIFFHLTNPLGSFVTIPDSAPCLPVKGMSIGTDRR
jgi:hypothetical protein